MFLIKSSFLVRRNRQVVVSRFPLKSPFPHVLMARWSLLSFHMLVGSITFFPADSLVLSGGSHMFHHA